jgi:hypothetical protein
LPYGKSVSESHIRFQPKLPLDLPKLESAMGKKFDLQAMDFDQLWRLREELTDVLAKRITAEKLELERMGSAENQPAAAQIPKSSAKIL